MKVEQQGMCRIKYTLFYALILFMCEMNVFKKSRLTGYLVFCIEHHTRSQRPFLIGQKRPAIQISK